jgi:hypothetical protein
MKTFSHLWQYLGKLFLEWEVLQTKRLKKIKTDILCSTTSPPLSQNRNDYETMPKNVAEPDGQQMTSHDAYALHAG